MNYVDIPYDSLKQKLTTGAAGGELPDLVRSDIGWVAQFASLGVLAPLDEKMTDFSTFADATYPGSLATNAWNGHYYGLPLDTNTRVLVTSQAALDAAGVSAPPATFDDLKAMAAALKGKNIDVFADSGLQGWNILPWIWSGGGEITDAGLTTASGYLDGPKSVAAVQMLVDLYEGGRDPEPHHRQLRCHIDLGRSPRRAVRHHPRRPVDARHLEGPVPRLQADLRTGPGRPGRIDLRGGW